MKVGVAVKCVTCSRTKKPHGRSAPLESNYCDPSCPGYYQEPQAGCLWPNETEKQFGFPVCSNAVEFV